MELSAQGEEMSDEELKKRLQRIENRVDLLVLALLCVVGFALLKFIIHVAASVLVALTELFK